MKFIEDCKNHKKILYNRNNKKIFTNIKTAFTLKEALIYSDYFNISDSHEKTKMLNTFKYIHEKQEAGAIYCHIEDNKLKTFFAIVNENYTNNWYKYIKKFNIKKYIDNKVKTTGSKEFLTGELKQINKWTRNGCLINMFFYSYHNSYQTELIHMISELLNNKKIKDTKFIIWCKDFPFADKKHDQFFPQIKTKYDPKKFLPIYSQSTTKDYYDIPIPNADEWRTFTSLYFPPKSNCKFDDINKIVKVKWADKIEKGFFRGKATGCFFDERNPRIKVSLLSEKYPELLDAGIVNISVRDKVNNGVLEFSPSSKTFPIKTFYPMYEFGKYKYILNIKGNGYPYRTSFLYFFGSLILDVTSDFYTWYDLKPWVHYIPIKEDLTDLIEKITWCKNNDDECKKIAKEGKKYAKAIFNKNGVFEYLESILN